MGPDDLTELKAFSHTFPVRTPKPLAEFSQSKSSGLAQVDESGAVIYNAFLRAKSFYKDDFVEVQDLKARPERNGQKGIVTDVIRDRVALMALGRTTSKPSSAGRILLKPINIDA